MTLELNGHRLTIVHGASFASLCSAGPKIFLRWSSNNLRGFNENYLIACVVKRVKR